MTVLRIILGILMILGAGSILSMPTLSSVFVCCFISIFMFMSGIVSIVNFIEAKSAERAAKQVGMPHFKTDIGSLLFGIAAIVLFILARSSVIGEVLFMQIVSTLFGLWIILNGVSLIVSGVGIKRLAGAGWVAMIVLGVLLTIAGIACIVDCFAGLTALGTMFGIAMMIAGFSCIFA